MMVLPTRFQPFVAVLLAALLALSLVFLAAAQGNGERSSGERLKAWELSDTRVAAGMDDGRFSVDQLAEERARLIVQRDEIRSLESSIEAEIAPVRAQLEALGEPPEDAESEAPQIRAERRQLQQRISERETLLKQASQAAARASALADQILEVRREQFTDQLLSKGPSLIERRVTTQAFDGIVNAAVLMWNETSSHIARAGMGLSLWLRSLWPLILIAVALYVVIRVRDVATKRLMRDVGPDTPASRRALLALGLTFVRLFLPAISLAMILLAVWNSGLLGGRAQSLVEGLAEAALVVIAAYGLGGAFFSPGVPQLRLSQLDDRRATRAHLWLMLIALVVGLDKALVEDGPAIGLNVEALTLVNAVLILIGSIGFWRFARFLRVQPRAPSIGADGQPEEDTSSPLVPRLLFLARALMLLTAIATPVLAAMGYFAASRYFFFSLAFSGALIGGSILVYYTVREIVEKMVAPASTSDQPTSSARVRLIPIAVGFLLFCVIVPLLALVWGAQPGDLEAGFRLIADGISVGEVRLSPVDFFVFLMVFSIGYVLTRMFQGVIGRSVLPVMGFSQGARDAIGSGIGYVGIFFAAMIAISTTGVDLSNLAIVAGALSVGIGFGLQNIVNNFVSGLILLIERPIKTGDWVEIAGVHGTVRKVNVRSTEIETFDRSSMFVPNSELISGTVTNWTHSNLNGRIICKVGVAYGTDPRLVERILTEIARGHPMMLKRPAPYVLFRSFGSDALEFEIRGVLRDVNWILNVQSDINFEITQRFTEAGLEIPFKQTDLHLKNVDEIADAMARVVASSRAIPQETPDEDAPEDEETDTPKKAPRARRPRRQRPAGMDSEVDGDGDADY